MSRNEAIDCLVVGAGPAGLTAAIYLARFRLAIRVVDAGQSRAAMIPRIRNHAGYPGGIAGRDLLRRMRDQAGEFGAQVTAGLVESLGRNADLFSARVGGENWSTHSILLATGVVNNAPPMTREIHDTAVARGLLRYCPICDGYEVTDSRVAVIGTGSRGYKEATFLRMYTSDITLIAPDGDHDLGDEERLRLEDAGIVTRAGPCEPLFIDRDRIVVPLAGECLTFDSVYPALGSAIRSDLAVALGAETTSDGCLAVDSHQRTSVPGLYAAGDVTEGLDQISHAMGEAGIAAASIRNDLAYVRRLYR